MLRGVTGPEPEVKEMVINRILFHQLFGDVSRVWSIGLFVLLTIWKNPIFRFLYFSLENLSITFSSIKRKMFSVVPLAELGQAEGGAG